MTQAPGRVALDVIGGLAFAVASIPGAFLLWIGISVGVGRAIRTGTTGSRSGRQVSGCSSPDCWSVVSGWRSA